MAIQALDTNGEAGGEGCDNTQQPVADVALKKRDIWLAPGVLPNEDTDLRHTVKLGVENPGVKIPFNYFLYLLKAQEIAEREDVSMCVAVAGLGRIVGGFFNSSDGVESVNRLFRDAASGESNDFFKKIIQLEKIRAAVADAVSDLLELSKYQGSISQTEQMRDDSAIRDSILHEIERLFTNCRTETIDFFGQTRLAAEVLQSKALPRRLRKEDSLEPVTDDLLLYPLTEGALAHHFIIDKKGRYFVHRGGDTVSIDVKTISIGEALKEITASRFGKLYGCERKKELKDNWVVTRELDGYAFYPESTGRKEAKPCDPYYADYQDDSQYPIQQQDRPLKVPGVPWQSRWVQTFMKDPASGGLLRGEAQAVVEHGLNPVLRRYFGILRRNAPSDALLRSYFPDDHDYRALQAWIDDPSLVMPDTFGLKYYNDMVRIFCQTVSLRVRNLLGLPSPTG